jgi:hypothetical protein
MLLSIIKLWMITQAFMNFYNNFIDHVKCGVPDHTKMSLRHTKYPAQHPFYNPPSIGKTNNRSEYMGWRLSSQMSTILDRYHWQDRTLWSTCGHWSQSWTPEHGLQQVLRTLESAMTSWCHCEVMPCRIERVKSTTHMSQLQAPYCTLHGDHLCTFIVRQIDTSSMTNACNQCFRASQGKPLVE